jgi:DNA-binding NarL/FixJ family response regulator
MPKGRGERASQARALVVEDASAWQALVSEILMECGLAVEVAFSAEEAILLARQSPHRLAVVDLALGEGDAANREGLRVLAALRRQDPGCVAVLLTGYATVEVAVQAMGEYGAVSCLQKAAFDRAEFRALVQRVLSVAPASARVPHGALSPTPQAGPHGREPGVPTVRGGVLVVEDDAGWRSILAELLSESGYQVRLCNGYGEAVGCLRRESYALAVVDLSLGGATWGGPSEARTLDGYQLLALARDEGVATVVVSGVADPEVIERAYAEYGIFSYLEKPSFDRRAFLETLAEAHATAAASQEMDALTSREVEVLALLARGRTNKEIAETLVISPNTVKRHLKAIFDKLGVHTRAAAATKATGAGIGTDAAGARAGEGLDP